MTCPGVTVFESGAPGFMIKSEIKRKFSDETSTGYAEHRYNLAPDIQISPKTQCLICVQRGTSAGICAVPPTAIKIKGILATALSNSRSRSCTRRSSVGRRRGLTPSSQPKRYPTSQKQHLSLLSTRHPLWVKRLRLAIRIAPYKKPSRFPD
jgi:hypothetical protein